MEQKRNVLLLVALILGVGVMVLWGAIVYQETFGIEKQLSYYYGEFVFNLNPDAEIPTLDEYKEMLNGVSPTPIGLIIWHIASLVAIILAVILNVFGWLKKESKKMHIVAILYFLSLNIPSAIFCCIEYFDAKSKIKNKLLLYTFAFSLFLALAWIALWISIGRSDGSYSAGMIIHVLVTMGIGALLNFLALNFFGWNMDTRILKRLAGVFYILGILTIVSGIICLVSSRKTQKQEA